MTITHKYLAALFSVAIAVLSAIIVLPSNALTGPSIVQLVALGGSAVGTYFLPLAKGKWAGALKTGLALLAVIAAWLYPLLVQGGALTGAEIIVGVLAVLNALSVEVGVNIRSDAIANPPVPTTILASLTGADKESLVATAVTAATAAAAQATADLTAQVQTAQLVAASPAEDATTSDVNPENQETTAPEPVAVTATA